MIEKGVETKGFFLKGKTKFKGVIKMNILLISLCVFFLRKQICVKEREEILISC